MSTPPDNPLLGPVATPAAPAPTPPAADQADPPPIPLSVPLPSLLTAKSPKDALAAIATAARRGRMAGFDAHAKGALFRVAAFGAPFDGELLALAEPAGDRTRLRFRPRFKPLIPWVYIIILITSIWPGVVLTEGLVASLIPGSAWQYTWWWYMPLTAPFTPWVFWSALKKSRASVHDSAHRAIEKIAAELAGTLEPAEPKPV